MSTPKLAVLIGNQRWLDWRGLDRTGPDVGEEFLDDILRHAKENGFEISLLILHPEDRLVFLAEQRGISVLRLPPEFSQSASKIREIFRNENWKKNRALAHWFEEFKRFAPELGFVFLGSHWIPPQLYEIPKLGFINFHPAPLPQWAGYVPEFAMILEDVRSAWGTLHRLDERFDTGKILATSPPFDVPEFTVPHELVRDICHGAFPTIRRTLHAVLEGTAVDYPAETASVQKQIASLKNTAAEAVIRWESDTHRKIDCRLRTFRAYEYEPDSTVPPLTATIEGYRTVIRDVELFTNDEVGANIREKYRDKKPGEIVGRYRASGAYSGGCGGVPPTPPALYENAPMLRTIEGLAVVLIDDGHMNSLLIPSGSRQRHTVLH